MLAGLLGWEREHRHRSAGLRTHMIVGISGALIIVLAEILVDSYGHAGGGIRTDPIRAIQGTVSGLTLLAAGAIFMSRGEARVKGLTTAASLLATACIGMACGLAHYILATGATVMLLIVLWVLRLVEPKHTKPEQAQATEPASLDDDDRPAA